MAKADTHITVWFDGVSDDRGWIVDRCDEDGNSETVKCYEVELDEDDDGYDDEYSEAEESAREFAAKYSAKTGLQIR